MLKKNDLNRLLDFTLEIQNTDYDFRQKTLDMISELFNYPNTNFFLYDINRNDINLCNPTSTKTVEKAMNSYIKHYFYKDIFHKAYCSNLNNNLHHSKVITVKDLMSYYSFTKSEYYNDFLKCYHWDNQIVLPLNYDNRQLGAIAILKQGGENDFTIYESCLLSKLNEIITQSLNMHLKDLELNKEANMFRSSSSVLPSGLMILNYQFSYIYINDTAKEYCKIISQNRNYFNHSDEYINKIIDLFAVEYHKSKNSEINIDNHTFKIYPFIVSNTHNTIETMYTIYITENPQSKKINDEKLINYKLTKREIEIIDLLLKGLTNNEMADSLFLSSHTIRTHIQNIYSKMNVTNRTALLYKLNS
ncbi:hypothetical protein AN1V17_41480 [Vallitalea sediminicola]